jgi:hypothetical protein
MLDNAGDVFVEFILEAWLDQALPPLNGEDQMNVELGKGVGHSSRCIAIVNVEAIEFKTLWPPRQGVPFHR